MALHYSEFDSNSQSLLADLRTQILLSSDWARLSPDTVLATSTLAITAGTSSFVTVADTSGLGLSVGSVIAIDNGVLREHRTLTGVTATQLQFGTNLVFAHSLGAQVRLGNNIYKAITTRGAEMVVDLSDSALETIDSQLAMAIYASHDGTTGVGKALKYISWRYLENTASHTHPLHVTLSCGKEHFFLMIEGPRPGETGAVHAQFGSFRNYFFLSDVVPYDEEDTIPIVFAGGANMISTNASVPFNSHLGYMSKNLAGTAHWTPARVASLQFIQGGDTAVLNLQRRRQLDDRFILAPYVVFGDESGMRGRLQSFFFAGINQSTDYAIAPPPLGDKVQYQGLWYKLLAVNKGDGNRAAWGPLGAVGNESTTTYLRSVVVGVPCPP